MTTEHLSLDASETRAVAEAMGAELDDSILEEVIRDTDGWPLGVHLVGGALAEADDASPGPRRTQADAVALAHHYVEDEWLRGLEPADADLLRRVSGLGWVSGALCDHVLGTSDSGMRLERLHINGLMVAPLDRQGDYFRVHQVIRDTLDESFQRRDRDAHRKVHQRACDWFESTGAIDRAVEQALRVDDVERAHRLVVEHGAFVPHERPGADRRALARCDSAITGTGQRRPVPGVRRRVARSRRRGRRCGVDEIRRTRARRNRWRRRHRVHAAFVPVDALAGSPPRVRHDGGARAADELPPGPWRVLARTTKGALYFALGDDVAALDAFSEATAEAHAIDAPSIEAIGLAHLALVLSATDQSDQALRRRDRPAGSCAIATSNTCRHSPSRLQPSALAESRSGDSEVAHADLLLARTHLASLHSVAQWHHLQANLALADASLRLGDHVAARMFLREAESLLEHHGDAVRYKQQVADLAQQLRAAKDVLPYGPSSLTTAELRVLHYLPTNLTHEEIAARLYVSRNTTKSHAASIYRKLGVASRSEAVEVARTAGLLPQV